MAVALSEWGDAKDYVRPEERGLVEERRDVESAERAGMEVRVAEKEASGGTARRGA